MQHLKHAGFEQHVGIVDVLRRARVAVREVLVEVVFEDGAERVTPPFLYPLRSCRNSRNQRAMPS